MINLQRAFIENPQHSRGTTLQKFVAYISPPSQPHQLHTRTRSDVTRLAFP